MNRREAIAALVALMCGCGRRYHTGRITDVKVYPVSFGAIDFDGTSDWVYVG